MEIECIAINIGKGQSEMQFTSGFIMQWIIQIDD